MPTLKLVRKLTYFNVMFKPLSAAVKTILLGEDVNAAKPSPRLTLAKRRQIEAAEAWRPTRSEIKVSGHGSMASIGRHVRVNHVKAG